MQSSSVENLSQPIKIAFVVNRVVTTGPIIVLRDIVHYLAQTGLYSMEVVELRSPSPSDEMVLQLQELGCRIHSLGFSLWELELCTNRVANRVAQLLGAQAVSLVHSHTYHPDLVVSRLPASFTLLSTQHNLSGEDFMYKKGTLLGRYMHGRLMLALKKFPHLVGITEYVSRYYRCRLPDRTTITTIYNGIDEQRFCLADAIEKQRLRTALNIPLNSFAVVMVGSLSKRKDPLTAISAVRWLKERNALPQEFLLLLLGSGELHAACQKAMKGLEAQVRLEGFVSAPEDYMRAADAALTATHSEGFGLNVAEAVFCGLPTATTTIGALLELTEPLTSLHPLRFAPKEVARCAGVLALLPTVKLPDVELTAFRKAYSQQEMGQKYHHLYQQLYASRKNVVTRDLEGPSDSRPC